MKAKSKPPTVRDLRRAAIPRQLIAEIENFLQLVYPVQHRELLNTLHRERLAMKRKRLSSRCWHPKKKLGELPLYSQRKAWAVRLVIRAYYRAICTGCNRGQAGTVARVIWLLIFGNVTGVRNIDRLIRNIEARGGPHLAPIEAYADEKSVPHLKARKVKS